MDKKRFIVILIFIFIFSISIIGSFLYNKDKYSVTFETGTSELFLTQYVGKNDKINKPSNPTKDGYVFKEWQLDGKKFDFDSEIDSDTVLTAKWIKEEYVTINFDTKSSNSISPIKILKGDTIDNIPTPIKDNYEFIGWYLNGKLYESEEVYDDIVLVAEYKNDSINTTYKVGDSVTITGEYSNSSNIGNKTYTKNKKAIGWNRVILDINLDNEFPYVVGNEFGITGFFKASSIEKR